MLQYYYVIVSVYLLVVVDCYPPHNATGVIVDQFNNTLFGALITFHCEESHLQITTVCRSDGEWDPDPSSLQCPTTAPGITPSTIHLFVTACVHEV